MNEMLPTQPYGTDTVFKLDTGARVNILPETELLRLTVKPAIKGT